MLRKAPQAWGAEIEDRIELANQAKASIFGGPGLGQNGAGGYPEPGLGDRSADPAINVLLSGRLTAAVHHSG